MRVFALEDAIGNQDSYGNSWGTNGEGTGYFGSKNMYAYKPPDDRWNLLLWDLDQSFGNTQETTTDLFQCSNEPTLSRMYTNAPFLRAYWRAAQDAVNGPMQVTNYNPIIDTNNAALVANGVSVQSTDGMKDWIDERRSYITNRLAVEASAPFEISNNNGNDFIVTNQPSVLLTGKAPVEVAFLRVNSTGTNALVSWASVTNWSLTWPLISGSNGITVQGYGRLTNLLSGMSDFITITNQP
jgi:hypothetical protein